MNASEIDRSKAPEGATHYNHHDDTTPWRKVDTGGTAYWWNGAEWVRMKGKGCRDGYIAIPNDSSPQWPGTGLPPVGTMCEVDYEGWTKCEVIAHFQQRCGMVAAFTIDQIGNGAKTLDAFGAEHFRPIRTPEQIAADERENAVAAMHEIYMDGIKNVGGLHALYDAGYRKVEGDKQ